MDADLARHRRHAGGPAPGGRLVADPAGRRRVGAPLAHTAGRADAQHPGAARRRRSGHLRARHRARLARDQLRIPRPAPLRVGARPAAGAAGVRHRLRVARAPRLRRAAAIGAAQLSRTRRGVAQPARVLGRRAGDDARVLPVRLSAGPHRLPRAGRGHAGDRARAGPVALAGVLSGLAADGAPVAGGRHLAGHDGSAGGFRHRRHLRLPHADRSHLSRVVRHVRSHRGHAAGEPPAALRAGAAGAGALARAAARDSCRVSAAGSTCSACR